MEITISWHIIQLLIAVYLGWMWSLAFHAVMLDDALKREFTVLEHIVGIAIFPITAILASLTDLLLKAFRK